MAGEYCSCKYGQYADMVICVNGQLLKWPATENNERRRLVAERFSYRNSNLRKWSFVVLGQRSVTEIVGFDNQGCQKLITRLMI